MNDVQVLSVTFDYDHLDSETRIVVQQRASEIRTIARRAASDAIEIGQKLIEVKARLGHGQFGRWLEAEFAWQERTAQSFMAVAERFKSANIADLNFAPTALYMLAQPSVPDEARAEAIQRAEQGERITVATAQAIVAEHMADAAELKPAVRAWAAQIDPADPRGVLQQMVITGSPVALRHFEQLGDALRAAGYRFMRSELLAALRRLIEELARPIPAAPRTVSFSPADEPHRAATAPVTRAKCKVCGRPLSDPASIARGAGDVCLGHDAAPRNGHTPPPGRVVITDRAPIIEPRGVEITAGGAFANIVLAWLMEKVEALELAEDSQRYCLEQIVKARSGQPSAGGASAWRELRALRAWPPRAADDSIKLDAVKAAIARLKGEPEEEIAGSAQTYVSAQPAPPDQSVPVNISSAAYLTLLNRKRNDVERFLAACRVLRPWTRSHGDLIEDDEQLRDGFSLLEEAYTQAIGPD